VVVVIGGGSGHYPAFAGLVGSGLAHAAAMGNVFASPSAQQVYTVAKSVATEAGVLLLYGNYAGDALNFDQAQDRLRAEGIKCETVRVTDDIYSAPESQSHRRRGIAGDLAVFKVASWAAENNWDLESVVAVTSRANEQTRSFGVAFSGITLPGATSPLFTVPPGHMAVGMGIHGEPGISIQPLPTASGLGALFVSTLLENRPPGGITTGFERVAVIVNGLGSIKGEELFLIYATVAAELEAAGVQIIAPEVGEYATSFEMAGVSLTLMWLDSELEAAWIAPAYTPAFRKGAFVLTHEAKAEPEPTAEEGTKTPRASAGSISAGLVVRDMLSAIRDEIDRVAPELGRLDSIAGDGDHGIGMQRGARAAAATAAGATDDLAGAGTVLLRAGDAWADKAGGTSGALWGAGLRAAGARLGDDRATGAFEVAEAVDASRAIIQMMGKAVVGDKTLVDALVPFTVGLTARVTEGMDLSLAWTEAAADATIAAEATSNLVARMGRARSHGQNSVGTADPGAISLALALTVAGSVLKRARDEHANLRGQ